MLIRLGLPIPGGALAAGARAINAPVLVSANALAVRDDHGEFVRFRAPVGLDGMDAFLDSAGFVAMAHYGAYPWEPEQYVAQCVAGFPWAHWSAMNRTRQIAS